MFEKIVSNKIYPMLRSTSHIDMWQENLQNGKFPSTIHITFGLEKNIT